MTQLCNDRNKQTISMDKKYKVIYKEGNNIITKPARIICIDRKDCHYTVLALVKLGNSSQEAVLSFTSDGFEYHTPSYITKRLVEITPYEDFKIDDPVYVSNTGDENNWRPRYFAGVDSSGKPLCWESGKTSFTAEAYEKIQWEHCRKAIIERLK